MDVAAITCKVGFKSVQGKGIVAETLVFCPRKRRRQMEWGVDSAKWCGFWPLPGSAFGEETTLDNQGRVRYYQKRE